MEMSGRAVVKAPPPAVWDALIDPDFLSRLIPGCEAMSGDPASGYDITVARGVGGMTARLSGRIEMLDVEPGRGCRLRAEGRGGAAGLATGGATIRLRPEGEGTRLEWDIAAALGGRLAALPDWVVRTAAGRVADGFVERFAAAIEGRAPRTGLLGRLRGR